MLASQPLRKGGRWGGRNRASSGVASRALAQAGGGGGADGAGRNKKGTGERKKKKKESVWLERSAPAGGRADSAGVASSGVAVPVPRRGAGNAAPSAGLARSPDSFPEIPEAFT